MTMTETFLSIFYDVLTNDNGAGQSGAILLSLDTLHRYTCIYLSIMPVVFNYTRVYNISINKQRTAPQIAGSAASPIERLRRARGQMIGGKEE